MAFNEQTQDFFSPKTKALLRALLHRDPGQRLGSNGAGDIRKHLSAHFGPPEYNFHWAKMSRRAVGHARLLVLCTRPATVG
jgi:hypothetical protein